MSDTSVHEEVISEYQTELANAKHLAINYKVLYKTSQEKLEQQNAELEALRQELVNKENPNGVGEPEVITTVE